MRILSWNVRGAFPWQGSRDRIAKQIEYLRDVAGLPDLLLLNEVTTLRRELWHDLLNNAGYTDIVDTLDWALELRESDVPPHGDIGHVNGNLTAIHEESAFRNLVRLDPSIRDEPVADAELKHWSTNFPEKILVARVEWSGTDLDLWNIRTVPGSIHGEEKIKILEDVYHRILLHGSMPRILAGDFNAPKAETEQGEVVSWGESRRGDLGKRWTAAEQNILTGLDQVGMVDVFRTVHGYGDVDELDVSFPTSKGEPIRGRRFDHVLASTVLNPRDCYYDSAGLTCSDHAPVIAEFSPSP